MILLIIIGLAAGIVSGMGIGGGTILIPALTIVKGIAQQSAQSINLIYFIPTAVIALFTHIKNKNIESKIVFKLVIYGLIGAAAGSFIAVNIDGKILQKIFGGFLLIMGIMELLKNTDKSNDNKKHS